MKARAISSKFNIKEMYKIAEEQILKEVPAHHTRIVRKKTEALFKEMILNACDGEVELKPGMWIYYIHYTNISTRKWPHEIMTVECQEIKSIGKKCCVTYFHRPDFKYILAAEVEED